MENQIKIFILEDDDSYLNILTTKLKSFLTNIEIQTAKEILLAKEFFANSETNFDLIILDEYLPDGRGIELLQEAFFENQAVIIISSDPCTDLPSKAYKAGAMYFFNKTQIREGLFEHLIQGVIDRNRLSKKLLANKIEEAKLDTVKTLVSTLRHEINNPLGAVLGAAYLIKSAESANTEQKQTAELVENSAKRIMHVLNQLCDAVSLSSVKKASEGVFHIPGDKEWE